MEELPTSKIICVVYGPPGSEVFEHLSKLNHLRNMKWVEFLLIYTFVIKNKDEKLKKVAYMLSQRVSM